MPKLRQLRAALSYDEGASAPFALEVKGFVRASITAPGTVASGLGEQRGDRSDDTPAEPPLDLKGES